MSIVSLINYLVLLAVAFLAIAEFIKDRKAYKSPKLRFGVLTFIVLVTILSIVNLYLTNRQGDRERHRAEAEKAEAKQDQARLEGELKGGQDTAVKAIKDLNLEVADLKSKIRTEELKKQLVHTEAELQATQKALAPGPKASLTFTFAPFVDSPIGQEFHPVREVILGRKVNLSIHVEFAVINLTDVTADDIELTVIVCDACKFAKEPEGFEKTNNISDNQRIRSLARLLPQTFSPNFSADVSVPPSIRTFRFGISYRCKTCDLPRSVLGGTVHIANTPLTP